MKEEFGGKLMSTRPNVIFVLTDDQGYGDLGCTGNPNILTPHIDQFYKESTRLTNYHVGPTCAPTRAGLMTGHYANSTGVWHTVGGRSLLREDEWTLPNALQEAGYATGIFGKWHLGDTYPYRAQDRGFTKTLVHGGGGVGQTPDYWGNDYFDDTYQEDGTFKKFKGYCTDVFFEEALKFVDENKEKPFFCYIACNAPHTPYNVEKRYMDLYTDKLSEDRSRFYGMISNIDDNFGKMIAALKEKNLLDETIVIFMTDNGSSMGMRYDEKGQLIEGYNAGLRGQKGSPYDGGHRTPFFIKWDQGGILTNHDIEEVTANVDFMPTILDLCGVQVPEKRSFDGVSLKQVLTDADAHLEERLVVTDSQRLANPIKWRESCVLYKQWRLINGIELYDIEADRAQENEISQDHPEIVEQLRAGYDTWWEKVSGKFEEPIPLHLIHETILTTHDCRGDGPNCAWHQGYIRQGYVSSGEWEVLTEKEGFYSVELSRWPEETGYPLGEGIEGNDVDYYSEGIAKHNLWQYHGGEALAIQKASLYVNGEKVQEIEVDQSAWSASFEVKLKEGHGTLEGEFMTTSGQRLGAYYARIRFLK